MTTGTNDPHIAVTPSVLRRPIAAFDFDGTLTRRDTLVPFLVRAAGRRRFARALVRMATLGAVRRAPLRDRDRMKELMIRDLLGGAEEAVLRRLAEAYAHDLLAHQMDPAVLERLAEHRRSGHEIVFVSASLVYYLEPIAESLGVDAVIAVEPSTQAGVLDGSLSRPNVRAHQKAVRLNEWIEQSDPARRNTAAPAGSASKAPELWAYGNSSGDHELLAMADHAYWLGPPRKRPPGVLQFDSAPLT